MAERKSNFWREVFSENGVGSSKRIIGTLMIVVVMACTGYLTIKFGDSETVKSICETSIIVGASLLGLSSVTGIWRHGSVSVGNQRKKKPEISDEKQDEEELDD